MVQLDASNYMARIIGCQEAEVGYYTSSGSEHDGGEESPSLSDLVDCFIEESCSDDYKNNNNDAEEEEVDDKYESSERVDSVSRGLYEELHRLVSDKEDQYRNALLSQVYSALETLQLNLNHQMALRGVVSHLRSLGYNAAVCKTKWDTSSSGGLVSGSHEFIDVVVTNSSSSSSSSHVIRYVIELDLASKFEIARPTESYKRLLSLLHGAAFVSKEMEMKKIVKVMSEAAKRSLKRREMYLPPWRKNRYMQMMWFGPYKRTTNAFPAAALPGRNGGGGMWKAEFIRAVGFNPIHI
ncbi:hypothetical protein QQ045_002226 [Rhodiola kirilowii]